MRIHPGAIFQSPITISTALTIFLQLSFICTGVSGIALPGPGGKGNPSGKIKVHLPQHDLDRAAFNLLNTILRDPSTISAPLTSLNCPAGEIPYTEPDIKNPQQFHGRRRGNGSGEPLCLPDATKLCGSSGDGTKKVKLKVIENGGKFVAKMKQDGKTPGGMVPECDQKGVWWDKIKTGITPPKFPFPGQSKRPCGAGEDPTKGNCAVVQNGNVGQTQNGNLTAPTTNLNQNQQGNGNSTAKVEVKPIQPGPGGKGNVHCKGIHCACKGINCNGKKPWNWNPKDKIKDMKKWGQKEKERMKKEKERKKQEKGRKKQEKERKKKEKERMKKMKQQDEDEEMKDGWVNPSS